tara:strand:- start:1515 stop:1706 length:192 start_codon:yes stop_codon:yes gene_type:complete
MTKKQLEEKLEEQTSSNIQMNEALMYIVSIVKAWQNKKIGNLRAITTISKVFIKKEKENESKS